jgi:hypothetical protein
VRRWWLRGLALLVLLALVVVSARLLIVWALADQVPTPADAERCTRQNGHPAAEGRKLAEETTLTPAGVSAQPVINIGADRHDERLRIRLEADRPLPRALKPNQIEIFADPLLRSSGDALETVSFPEPTFSEPTLVSGRRRMVFVVCLAPSGVPAGRYTGAIQIGGPEGLTGTTVPVTVNAKNLSLFLGGGLAALVLALLLLAARGIFEKRAEQKDPAEAAWPAWRTAAKDAATDPQMYVTGVIALGGAFGALTTTYVNDPAWGASAFASVFALLATALAAVGGQSLLAGLRQGRSEGGGAAPRGPQR